MKVAVLFVSILALFFTGMSLWTLDVGGVDFSQAAILFFAGWAVAVVPGILGAVNAGALGHAVVTALAVVVIPVQVATTCVAILNWIGPNPYDHQALAWVYAPPAGLALAAMLSALLLRPVAQKPAAPEEPPPGTP
jgi:hypothetical protein